MTEQQIRQLIKDLENTEIPFLKKQLFNAETLVRDAGNKDVVNQAKRDISTYKDQIKNYQNQLKQLKRAL